MTHYAFLDDNNNVTEIIVGIDETELIEGLDPETWYGNFRGKVCKITTYEGDYRKNPAGIGFTYDFERDAFIAPKPFDSWILDEETCRWKAPIPYPNDNLTYLWDETELDWILSDFAHDPTTSES